MLRNRALIAMLATLCLAPGALRAELDQSIVDALQAVWQGQHKALDAHDIEGVMATYADSDDIMLMGTGPGEHYVGPDEIRGAYTQFMEDFDAQTLSTSCSEGSGSRKGDVVWFTAVCAFTDQKGETQRSFTANLSGVALQEGDDWRFHTMHFSHLTGSDQNRSEQP